MLRRCYRCKNEKSIEEFYPSKHFGRSYSCKECDKKHAVEWAKKKRYFKSGSGKEALIRASKKSRAKYPEKDEARIKLREAVRKGEIVKPKNCVSCGGDGQIHGHHTDYTKPYDVQWLCRKCHSEVHKVRVRSLTTNK